MIKPIIFFNLITISLGCCAENQPLTEITNKKRDINFTEKINNSGEIFTNPRMLSKNTLFWPNQDYQQYLRGEETFPRNVIENIYESSGGRYESGAWVLTTRSVIRDLALSASYGNPVAMLYLAHAFNQTHHKEGLCPLASKLYERAFSLLEETALTEKSLLNGKAKYFIAKEQYEPRYGTHYEIVLKKYSTPLEDLSKLPLQEANLLIKLIKAGRKEDDKITIKDFLDPNDLKYNTGYFLKSLNLFGMTKHKKRKALEKAIKITQHPALYLKLSSFYKEAFYYYKEESYKTEALNLLEEASKLGSAIAYRETIEFFALYSSVYHSFNFQSVQSSEDLNKCKDYLEKAADLKFPEAFFNLALYTKEYYKRIKNNDGLDVKYLQEIKQSIEHYYKFAGQYGFWNVYNTLNKFLQPDDNFFIEYPDLNTEKRNLFRQAMNQ